MGTSVDLAGAEAGLQIERDLEYSLSIREPSEDVRGRDITRLTF